MYYAIDEIGTEMHHDSLRIKDAWTLELILKNSPQINIKMEDYIRDLLFDFRYHKWEFTGIKGGYNFKVWDGNHDKTIVNCDVLFDSFR